MPELALGTVQFGLAYGVAGRGKPIPDTEARAILRRAWALGIRRLDTAPVYGDIEERLADLCGELPFAIVSKIPPLPPEAKGEAGVRWIAASVARSRKRLGERLCGLLFHRAEDLAETTWAAAEAAADDVALGLSCYDAATLAAAAERFPIAAAQLPGSAFDQSIASAAPALPAMEITLRSLFLQGLLLMGPAEAAARVPAARAALDGWGRFCAERGVSRLSAALAVAKGLPAAYCAVGVDNEEQLEQVAETWAGAAPLAAPQLDTRDARVIDPRRWSHG